MLDAKSHITKKTDVMETVHEDNPCYGEVHMGVSTMQWFGHGFPGVSKSFCQIVTQIQPSDKKPVYKNSDGITEQQASEILRQQGGWDYLE